MNGLWQALSLAWQLGYMIALPLVIFALTGRFLDRQFGSSPVGILIGILLALSMSGYWLLRKINELKEKM